MVQLPSNTKRVDAMSVVSNSFVNIGTKRSKGNDIVIGADELMKMLGTFSENCFAMIIDVCLRQEFMKLVGGVVDLWKFNHTIMATIEFWVGFGGF